MALVMLLASCEKEVHVNLSSGPPSVVIQGAIETDLPPYIVMTRSVGYLSKIDLSTLENSFVHDAKVTVSDGSQQITLREYAVDTGGSNKFFFYSIDTADLTSFNFRGRTDRFYTLTVEVAGKTYTSVTKVPNVKPLDNIWVDTVTAPPDKIPLARLIYFKYTDPDTPGNCVRYFTKRNSEPFYPGTGSSVYNDEIVNGSSISTNFSAGYDHSKSPNLDSLGFFYVGDTVTIKWAAIDKGVYKFWNTFEFATGTVGNPFASPINVQTNITGGALGIWAGYGTVQRTIIVSK
jgi:hypothetical protein